MVEFAQRTMSDKRGAMSAGHDRMAGLVETMMTADGLRLTADSLRPACQFDGPDKEGYTEP